MNDAVLDVEIWADAYVEAHSSTRELDCGDPLWWTGNQFFELIPVNPKLCMSVILRVVEKTDSPTVLEALGAGPLEDLIEEAGAQVIAEIEWEAKHDPKFRRLLGYVWESGGDAIWNRVLRARDGRQRGAL